MSNNAMKLTTKQVSGAHRKALIELGEYSRPTHKVHKNKKAFTRKVKHKNKEV